MLTKYDCRVFHVGDRFLVSVGYKQKGDLFLVNFSPNLFKNLATKNYKKVFEETNSTPKATLRL
jgi:hypothetical protein